MKRIYALCAFLALLLVCAPLSFGAFVNVVDLSQANIGSAVPGEASGDEAGFSVATIPDMNNDGVDELLIGAPYANNTGVAYLIYGQAGLDLNALDLSNLGAAGVRIPGESADDFLGFAVASAGDVNGDNRGDFLIGAPGHDGLGADRGRCYLVYGSGAFPQTLDLSTLGAGGLVMDGAGDYDLVGYSLAMAGDFGGSANNDIIIGAPLKDTSGGLAAGVAYVVYWDSSLPQTVDLGSLGANGASFEGAGFLGNAGLSVSGGMDFNGDGTDDIIIGAPGDSNGVKYFEGRAFLVYGGSGFTSPVDLSAIDTNGYGIIFEGNENLSQTGFSVAGIGDFNGDGFGDVAISAPLEDGNSVDSGCTYVRFGNATPATYQDLGAVTGDGLLLKGEDNEDGKLGVHLFALGDVNNDSMPDLGIGVPFASTPSNPMTGKAYVVIGNRFYADYEEQLGANGSLKNKTSVFYAVKTGEFAGNSMAAGDVNDDGFSDLIMGASSYSADPDIKLGRVHLVNGQDLGSTVWPHSAPTTGEGAIGKANMSFVPYLDAWGDFTSGSKQGFTLGLQVDPAWSQQVLPFPIYNGFLLLGYQVIVPNGLSFENIVIWPFYVVTIQFPVWADTGRWIQEANFPAGMPSGVGVYLQQVWANPSNANDLAATNCLCLTIK